MSSKIQAQSTKVWQILTNPETVNTYKNVVTTTWSILKESAILVWLMACLILVLIDWFWTNSIFAGQRVRVWVNSFDEPNTNQIASNVGKQLLSASKLSVASSISNARALLGLPEKKEPVLELSTQKTPEQVSGAVMPSPAVSPVSTPAPTTISSPESPPFSEPSTFNDSAAPAPVSDVNDDTEES